MATEGDCFAFADVFPCFLRGNRGPFDSVEKEKSVGDRGGFVNGGAVLSAVGRGNGTPESVLEYVRPFPVAAAGLLLADESWYFLILENYRDRRIWHVEPHPDIIRDKPEM